MPQLFGRTGNKMPPFVSKPSGYSFFPCDIFPVPKTWAAQTCNLVAYGQHSSGGHFAVSVCHTISWSSPVLMG